MQEYIAVQPGVQVCYVTAPEYRFSVQECYCLSTVKVLAILWIGGRNWLNSGWFGFEFYVNLNRGESRKALSKEVIYHATPPGTQKYTPGFLVGS